LIMGFIDTMRAEGRAVESICRVLREQGCQVAARTYRAWRSQAPAARTVSDAGLVEAIRQVCWKRDDRGVLRLAPEGLYGRRKLTAELRRRGLAVAECTVARAMRTLGHQGIRRAKGIRTTIPAKDGTRAGDLVNRDFSAAAPNLKWVSDFTYCRTWAGWVYVAFIVDVFAQRIVAWHVATTKTVELVMTPLRMALWDRDREDHPPVLGELICHSDAGSQGGFNRSSQHLDHGGVGWDDRGSRSRRRLGRVGSGPRIGRCGRRCARRAGPSRRGLCSGSSGV
jgi:putative transposase